MILETERREPAESARSGHVSRILVLVWVVGCSLLLFACTSLLDKPKQWLDREKEPRAPADLVDLGPESLKVKSVWSNSIGSPENIYHSLQPFISGDRVYVAGAENRIEAWDLSNGKRIWSVAIQEQISGGVNGGDEIVVVGTESGLVMALNSFDGEEVWRAPLSSEVLKFSSVKHGVIIARTNDSAVFALDVGNGDVAWKASRSSPLLTLRGASQPKIAGSAVLVGYDDGKLVALSLLDGEEVWRNTVSMPTGRSELDRIADIDGEIVYLDDVVYAVNFNGRAVAVDMVTGRMKWARDMSSHAGLGVDESRVYVVDEDSSIWALDRTSGATLWRQDKLLYRSLTAPVAMGDHIVVGDFKGYVHWLSKKDGQLAGRYKVSGDAIECTPFIAGQYAYVFAQDGSFEVLQSP